jgi:DNA-binding GntR family transcriptional regulator
MSASMSVVKPERSMDEAGGGFAGANGSPPAAQQDLLNRSAVVPLYYQLEEILERRILTGVWAAHDRLPSERELCEEFGVSRAVVRPALEILEREGRIIRVEGSGTFVAPPKRVVPIVGIIALFSGASEHDVEIEVLEAAERAPGADLARSLEIERRERVLHVSATVVADERPVCLCVSTIVQRRVPWLQPVLRAGARLRGFGPFGQIELSTARLEIEGGSCPEFEAQQLRLSVGSPLLNVRLQQLARLPGESGELPVEHAWVIYPAESVCATTLTTG